MNSVSTELKYCVFQISHCYAQLTPQERKKASWILKQSLNSLTITKNDATNLIKQTLHTICEFCLAFGRERQKCIFYKNFREENVHRNLNTNTEKYAYVCIYMRTCVNILLHQVTEHAYETFPYQLKVMEGKKASHQLPAYWILPSSSWINQKLN